MIRNKLFDGAVDRECMPSNVNCWYKGDEYKKSIKLASEYSDNDVIKVCKISSKTSQETRLLYEIFQNN